MKKKAEVKVQGVAKHPRTYEITYGSPDAPITLKAVNFEDYVAMKKLLHRARLSASQYNFLQKKFKDQLKQKTQELELTVKAINSKANENVDLRFEIDNLEHELAFKSWKRSFVNTLLAISVVINLLLVVVWILINTINK